jgi:hypothetical protein
MVVDGEGLSFAVSGLDNMKEKRKVLVILSNRLNRNQEVRFLELDCDDKGNVLKEKSLRAEPREARFDEVWENDEGKPDMSTCHRFKRKYRHKLERRKT